MLPQATRCYRSIYVLLLAMWKFTDLAEIDTSAQQNSSAKPISEESEPAAPTSCGGHGVRSRFGRFLSGTSGGGIVSSAASTAASTNAIVQLMSLPQLDSIQRTIRILDVRLQHVQSNACDDADRRSEIDHIRRLMTENQNALSTVVTILSSIQEEVRRISIGVLRHHQQQQVSALHIQPMHQRKQHTQVMTTVGASSRAQPSVKRSVGGDLPSASERKTGTRVFIGSSESPGSFV